ncbi:predicted protein [Sparassis crispa]|uniref:F-box domain-containing protein n=1 Tax=Sparassis crispa TaxID=139825 RepID=A0A401H2C0_9APHY|nr:predicted protein [Sparassis crispa]GBE88533.1 predicted protein [Sparassis crispa]
MIKMNHEASSTASTTLSMTDDAHSGSSTSQVCKESIDSRNGDMAHSAHLHRLDEDVFRLILEAAHEATEDRWELLFATRVASVCRAWRRIAIDTPSLWAKIFLLLRRTHDPLASLSTYLTRSRSQRLDVRIVTSRYSACTPPKILGYQAKVLPDVSLVAVFELLVPHIQRWRSMTVDVSQPSDLMQMCIDLWCGTAESLEVLSLLCELYNVASGLPPPPRLSPLHLPPTFSAPRMRSLVLQSTTWFKDEKPMHRCFPSLGNLQLHSTSLPTVGTFLAMLQPLRQLRHICLTDMGDLDGPRIPAVRQNFPALVSITFRFLYPEIPPGFLSLIEAPSLEKLTIQFPMLPLIPPYAPCFPSLHILQIDNSFYYYTAPECFTPVAALSDQFDCIEVIGLHNRGAVMSFIRAVNSRSVVRILSGHYSISLEICHRGRFSAQNFQRVVKQMMKDCTSAGASNGADTWQWSPNTARMHLHVRTCRVQSQRNAVLSPKVRRWSEDTMHSFSWSSDVEGENSIKWSVLPPNE